MEISDDFLRKVVADYFQSSLAKVLPAAIQEAVRANPFWIGQEYLSIQQVMSRYDLSRKTIYNYQRRGYINLYSSDGKTFVSVVELEAHIRKHPLPRRTE